MGTNIEDQINAPRSSSSDRERIRKAASSAFNYWFGYVANFSIVFWLLSRVLFAQNPISTVEWVVCFLGGIFFWTFCEYFLHKILYHEINSPLKVGHDLHHDEPKALLGVPWYLTTVIIVGLYYLLALYLNPARTAVVMAGTWLGYIGYCFVHHAVHHFNWTNRWFIETRKHHAIHHVKDDVNWGITGSFWDYVFRTKV